MSVEPARHSVSNRICFPDCPATPARGGGLALNQAESGPRRSCRNTGGYGRAKGRKGVLISLHRHDDERSRTKERPVLYEMKSLRDRWTRHPAPVFEHERGRRIRPEDFHHQARLRAAQCRAMLIVQNLERHRGVFGTGEHEERRIRIPVPIGRSLSSMCSRRRRPARRSPSDTPFSMRLLEEGRPRRDLRIHPRTLVSVLRYALACLEPARPPTRSPRTRRRDAETGAARASRRYSSPPSFPASKAPICWPRP
jgi:hypothetical protein